MVRFHLAPPRSRPGRHDVCVPGASFEIERDRVVFKKLLVMAGILGGAAFVARRVKTAKDERALWHEATTSPDLR
jgi:hypothetical protein